MSVRPSRGRAVRKEGPGVVDVPDRQKERKIPPDRPPDPRRRPIRAARFEGEPAPGPAAASIAQQEGGRRAEAAHRPDPGNGRAGRRKIAPEDGRQQETDRVRHGRRDEHVEKQGEQAGAAHIEWGAAEF